MTYTASNAARIRSGCEELVCWKTFAVPANPPWIVPGRCSRSAAALMSEVAELSE